MAHAAAVFAERDQQAAEFRCSFLRQVTHGLYQLSCLRCCLIAKSLVGNYHQFLGVDIQDHANRSVLRRFIPVIVVLPVVSLGFHIGLCVDMAAQVDTDPGRALYVETVS